MAKATKNIQSMLPDEAVTSKIDFITEQKVMLDKDLAEMYRVETRVLNHAVKRNQQPIPGDLCFN
ncbi:MAG: KilA-N, DNA-binding domain [Segetibacter sp.]|jgi:hypothetical protein|nr:KilA-N, DNA-binding domain [Segetibacter sp.]